MVSCTLTVAPIALSIAYPSTRSVVACSSSFLEKYRTEDVSDGPNHRHVFPSQTQTHLLQNVLVVYLWVLPSRRILTQTRRNVGSHCTHDKGEVGWLTTYTQ